MTVFTNDYAAQYDLLYGEKDYRGECDLVEQAFARADRKVTRILDVGCGTGGHVLELARRGYECTGVDLSSSMLALARDKAGDMAPAPKFVQGDARNFRVDGSFDAALMMFAVVSYLTSNDDVMKGLRNVRGHLAKGALFMCDFWYGPTVLSVRPSERVRVLEALGERKTIRAASTQLDTLAHTAEVSFRLWSIEGDRLVGETTEAHLMRYFFPQEISFMLQHAGFRMLSLSAFPSLDAPLTTETWNAFCVAEAV